MPRSGRGSAGGRPAAAPSRPNVAPAPRSVAPQQTRPATTAAYPPATAQRPGAPAQAPAQSGGSGLFGQMASTAAGVAVGSSIGHAIGGFFGGGSSQAAAPVEQQSLATADNGTYNASYGQPRACDVDIQNFRRCMDENQGSINICGYYLDQLKACQQAASQY